VQNEKSHYQGKYDIGSKHNPTLYIFDDSNANIQLVSAKESNAYPGTEMHRTMAIIKDGEFEKPFMLDILRVKSDSTNLYDLPFYFMGQVLKTNFEYEVSKTLEPLGSNNGYQHLWSEGCGSTTEENTKLSWLEKGKFYTLTSATSKDDELRFVRIGANDPEFNLRREAGFIIRRKDTDNTLFVSTIEAHGSYSPVSESAVNSNSSISALKIVLDTVDYTAISITTVKGTTKLFIIANTNASKEAKHTLKINNENYEWSGSYYFK